ncbi:MAG TPA: hypothetical protein VGB13_06470 [Candidatus Krumholzibacteria bacterium]
MGKAFRKELAALDDTYRWASTTEIGPLTEFVHEAHARPLVAIGSGGSATAAHLAALLHRFHAGAFARAATPLDVLLSEPNLGESAALLLSASGRNRDVLVALDRCVRSDARAVATLCTQRGSPLATAARRFERAYVFEQDAPCGKDGFLATNSLLAACIFLARAYGAGLPDRPALTAASLDGLDRRSTALVLHGGWGSPVATDLESKLSESAVASAQVSDYRNFGHGRHFWLARRESETMVIALVTPETAAIADRTRALLPSKIPVVELRTTHDGPAGMLDLLWQSFHVVGALAELQSFDPGRPSVPEFGRKLYHLPPLVPAEAQCSPVVRKLARRRHIVHEEPTGIRAGLERFVERICAASFGGIVLDYDGTLCARSDRFGVLRPEIADECRRLLEGAVIVGIATGRGRSVRESLQKALPRSSWERVIVGYYNGGEIAPLARDDVPSRDAPVEPPLDAAKDLLEQDPLLRELALFTGRRRQITVEPRRQVSTDALISHVMTLLGPLEQAGVRVLTSSHSVDVLPPGVGKLSVVREVEQRMKEGTEVLCVGDRGAWPGNDCALLSHVPSLSVDEVSASLTTCWNIAPAGVTGAAAVLLYLAAIRASDGRATMDARDLWRPG